MLIAAIELPVRPETLESRYVCMMIVVLEVQVRLKTSYANSGASPLMCRERDAAELSSCISGEHVKEHVMWTKECDLHLADDFCIS